MSLQCKAGQIEVRDIINAINVNQANITANDVDLVNANSKIDTNAQNIASNDARITALDGGGVPTKTEFDQLKGRVSTNETNIETNRVSIESAGTSITDNAANITTIQSDLVVVNDNLTTLADELVTSNTEIANNGVAIADLDVRVTKLEDISSKGAVLQHATASGVGGGDAAAGTWVARNIATVIYDDLGGSSSATAYALPPGEYKFTLAAVADADEHMSKIMIGAAMAVGTTGLKGQISYVSHIAKITVQTNISVVTKIKTVGSGDELGKANTLGEPNVYVTLTIDKVGQDV